MAGLNRTTGALIAVIAVACGGKTAVLEDYGDTGRSGSGGASGRSSGGSAGGAGAGGGNPAAGSGGRGGASGGRGGTGASGRAGSPGSGGVAGGSAGTGGVGTGGFDGSVEELMDAVCSGRATRGCDGTDCRYYLMRDYDLVSQWGCGTEYLERAACEVRLQDFCRFTRCAEADIRYNECLSNAEICVRANDSSGGCEIACEGWGSKCRVGPGGLICTCSAGRQVGLSFTTDEPCQSESWQKITRANCE